MEENEHGMEVNLRHRSQTCAHPEGCLESPDKGSLLCKLHSALSEPSHENSMLKGKCIHPACNRTASYGLSSKLGGATGLRLHCSAHREALESDLKSKQTCSFQDCVKRAMWKKPGDLEPSACKEHKEKDFIHVPPNRCCQQTACDKVARFGYRDDRVRRFCKLHASRSQDDLARVMCKHAGCKKQASFGLHYRATAEYCMSHKPANFSNVRKRNNHSETPSPAPTHKPHVEMQAQPTENVREFCC
mmetsp:Transcript_7998/g.26790  ORF Transcript_7998/g.26790 Transcript_7998/m.26790 type:complete len:246 (-) Transcript_7998:30-767(-)